MCDIRNIGDSSMTTENKLSQINFFLCSTFEDLKDYRKQVIDRIKSEAGLINAMEFYGARDKKPLVTCLEEVQKSQVFIMFLAWRHGSIEPTVNKSYCECEYDKAKELNLPKFVYFMDDSHPFPKKYVSTGDEANKLDTFKARLQRELTIDKFTTPEDLSNKIMQDLLRDLPSRGLKLGDKLRSVTTVDIIEQLHRFLAAPELYCGIEFRLAVELGNYSRVGEYECDAYSLRYGSAVNRSFTIVDNALDKRFPPSLKCIYADYENARKLIELPNKSKVDVTMKTISGICHRKEPIYTYVDAGLEYDGYLCTSISMMPGYKKRITTGYESIREMYCGLKYASLNVLATPQTESPSPSSPATPGSTPEKGRGSA
jgi:hypothetical protein